MAKLSSQELKKDISSRSFRPLYLIYGEEKYLVSRYTKKLVDGICGKSPNEFDRMILDSEASLDEIIASAEMLPVIAEKKCVCVRDYDFDALSESELSELEKYCEDLSPSTVLIFTMPTLTAKPKKKNEKKPAGFSRFIQIAEKSGAAVEFEKLGDITLERQLSSWAEAQSCTLTGINASKIISRVGTDLNALKNEIDKLCAYVNGGEITEDVIRLLCVTNNESNIYAMAGAISRSDFNETYSQLRLLFAEKEKPEIILSVLSSAFVDMYRMRAAVESGRRISDVAKDFNYGRREFVLKSANNNVRRFSTKALRRILDVILDADIKLKSTRTDAELLLDTLIAKLLIIVKEDGNR